MCARIIRLTVNNDNNNNILRAATDIGLGVDFARRWERVFPCQYQISFFSTLSSTYPSRSSPPTPFVPRYRRFATNKSLVGHVASTPHTCRPPLAGILACGRRGNDPVKISPIHFGFFFFFRIFSAIELVFSKYVSLRPITARKRVEQFTTPPRPFQGRSTSEID